MTKKELMEKRAKLFAQLDEMRQQFDGKAMTAEERAAWDKLTDDYKVCEDEIRSIERNDQMAEMRSRLEGTKTAQEMDAEKREMEIFRRYLVGGPSAVSAEERSSITGVNGSNLLPKSIANQIETALLASGGMMSVAEVIRTSKGEPFGIPTVNDTTTKATIVAAYNNVDKSNFTIGQALLGAFTYRTPIIPVSYELLQDSQFDLETYIRNLMVEQFARGLNDHFTNGAADSTTTPKGIVAAATQVNAAAAAASPAITGDDLLSLMSGVNSAYWGKAKYMFNAATLVEIMKLKDSNNRYIWSSMGNGTQGLIFGHEYVINPDMDSIGAGKAPVIFGDLSKYKIRLAKDMTFQRLNEALAEYLSIGIFGYMRADGCLVDAGTHPVARLQIASVQAQ